MKITLMTHRGAVRAENQDAVLVEGRVWTGDMVSPQALEAGDYPLLLAVVDGMGGYQGGARAAQILAEALADGAGLEGKDAPVGPEEDENALRRLLDKALARMKDEAKDNSELDMMGAAVAGLVLRQRSVTAFNCGDCRAYRLSGEGLERLTRDHSVVQELYEAGEVDEDGMRHHPRKNLLTSAVSACEPVFELYVRSFSRRDSDSFFICSDGVWEALSAQELAQHLSRPLSLFDALMESRCQDNVSFVYIREYANE